MTGLVVYICVLSGHLQVLQKSELENYVVLVGKPSD